MTKLEVINLALSALESRIHKHRIDFPVYWDWYVATDKVVDQLRAEREAESDGVSTENRAGKQEASGRDSGTVGVSNPAINPGPTAGQGVGESGKSESRSGDAIATKDSQQSATKSTGDAKVS